MRKTVTAIVVFAVTIAWSSAATAEDKEAAKRYFEIGVKLQKANDHTAAAEAFEKSVGEYANKNNLYNLANCYRIIGRSLDALATFERIQNAYSSKLSKAMAKDIESQIGEIKASLASLTIVSIPDGAKVILDGISKGNTPVSLPILLPAGAHKIEIVKDGYETTFKEITLSSGRHEESFTLREEKSELIVTVNEPGVMVYIDGTSVGVTPLIDVLQLEKGDHVVRLIKEGFKEKEQTISLDLAEKKNIEMAITRLPPPEPVPVLQPEPTQLLKDIPSKKKRPPLLAVGLAGTLVMSGVSAGLWGAGASQLNEYDSKNSQLDSLASNGEWDDNLEKQRDSAKESSEKLNKAAVVTTAITGAFVVLTVTGAILRASYRKDSPKPVSLTPSGIEVRF